MDNPFARRGARWLLVDFGAGPGTVLLATAEHVLHTTGAPLSVNYVHVDQSIHMFEVAKKYFTDDDAVNDNSRFFQVSDLENISDEPLDAWSKDCTDVLFAFSYVLCQSSVTRSVIRLFASTMARVLTTTGGRRAYLLMVDANLARSKWPWLVAMLAEAGIDARMPPAVVSHTSIYLNLDGSPRDIWMARDNLQYVSMQIG